MFSRLKKQKQKPEPSENKKEYLINGQQKVILNSRGLVPAILQDHKTNEILHLGYMDRWALDVSFSSNKVYLYRRSTGKIQLFGENLNLTYVIRSARLHANGRALVLGVQIIQEVAGQEAKIPGTSFVHHIKLV